MDQILKLGDYTYLDRPLLFRSAAERSPADSYNKPLSHKQGHHKVASVSENTLQIVQDGLKNTFSIHRATLVSISNAYLENYFTEEEQKHLTEKSRSENDSEEEQVFSSNLFVAHKIIRQIRPGPAFNMSYNNTTTVRKTILQNRPTTYPKISSTPIGADLTSGEIERLFWKLRRQLLSSH